MKERLPMWLQALAVTFLCGVWAGTFWWVEQKLEAAQLNWEAIWIAGESYRTLYLSMPAPILFLGIRFLLRHVVTVGRSGWVDGEVICVSLVSVASLLALIAVGYWTFEAVRPQPKIREAVYTAASYVASLHRDAG